MGGKRVFELVLEIGHKSTPLSKKLANGYTHKWTAFVRGYNNSKIEHCIQRVVFQLHESFDNPSRDITEQPFQIKETGYAGFEIPIEIYFKNREKPNHVVFIHDLSLLNNKPNDNSTIEKVKFINPNKEFEKCLIKSGAQLLVSALKKERSDSPPAKKQKSSSLIPSKDMSKQSQLQAQPQAQPQSHHHHSNTGGGAGGGSGKGSNHHQLKQQQPHQQQSGHKPKSSSKNFIDVFGAPLVYNKPDKWSTAKRTETRTIEKPQPQHQVQHQSQHQAQPQSQHQAHRQPQPEVQHQVQPQVQAPPQVQAKVQAQAQPKEEPYVNELSLIQNKISCLSDCDRLQKIVDIVEEAGEWFNLTPKKFEFDLKRLDRKTLSRIERCLPH